MATVTNATDTLTGALRTGTGRWALDAAVHVRHPFTIAPQGDALVHPRLVLTMTHGEVQDIALALARRAVGVSRLALHILDALVHRHRLAPLALSLPALLR